MSKKQLKILTAIKNTELSGRCISRETKIHIATMYYLISKLEKRKCVKSRWGKASQIRGWNRPKFYMITDIGEEFLNNAKG